MKTLNLKLLLLSLIVNINFSCNKPNEENISSETIGLETQDSNSFSGEKEINNNKLNYNVTLIKEEYYLTQLNINNQQLIAKVYFNNQHIDFLSENIQLTTEEKSTLLILGQEISKYLFQEGNTKKFTLPEYTLLRLLEYWARSPKGFVENTRSTTPKKSFTKSNKKLNNEGITCIRKNTYVVAEYDTSSGKTINKNVEVNGNLCLGRCGSGCGSWFSLASAWTKDCLDHDQCGRDLGGSTDPNDSNCGDEYTEAADDFLFGVIRGCSG